MGIDLDRILGIEDNPTVVVPYKELSKLQAESDRRLALLRRWNDNRVWNGHRCPFCLESPVVSHYVDEHHIEHEDAHADECELAEELKDDAEKES